MSNESFVNDAHWNNVLGPSHTRDMRTTYTRILQAGVKAAAAGYDVEAIHRGVDVKWAHGWIQVTADADNAEAQITRLRALAEVPVVRG